MARLVDGGWEEALDELDDVFALEPLIAANTCASVFTPSAGLILAIMAVAAAAICFFRKDYRRTEASRAGGGGAAG